LSDISDGSDTNFIYILFVSKCQQCRNEEQFKTNKSPKAKFFFTIKFLSHVTEPPGIKVFSIPKK